MGFYLYIDSQLNNEASRFLTYSLNHAFEPFVGLGQEVVYGCVSNRLSFQVFLV